MRWKGTKLFTFKIDKGKKKGLEGTGSSVEHATKNVL